MLLIWTINLKSFEINKQILSLEFSNKWTINLKSFEIYFDLHIKGWRDMNYKLEKFWNNLKLLEYVFKRYMNYKLEKFWNNGMVENTRDRSPWTINLKSFEIV